MARMRTYDQLRADGVVHWPRSTFDRIKASDPLFPRGIRDGKWRYYDAEQVQRYMDRYWAAMKERERQAAWDAAEPERERQRLAEQAERAKVAAAKLEFKRMVYRRILAWLDRHPGLVERMEPAEFRFFPPERVFDGPPPDDFEPTAYEAVVAGIPGRGLVEYRYVPFPLATIMARPLPNPPRPFDRTFGGLL